MDSPFITHESSTPSFLSGEGEMGRRIREFDWSKTALGSPQTWPQSLRTSVSICLNSNFPIAIYWSKDLTLIYNDAWSPIPGNKHPWALGRPAKEVWPEIWNDIEPQFQKAFNGEPGGSKDALLPMQRHGYTEECYFDFTFTPVYGEGGKVEGVFNAVIETTKTILNERQLQTLRELSNVEVFSKNVDDVFAAAAKALEKNNKDFPFAVIYKVNEDGSKAAPVGYAGLDEDQKVFPSSIDLLHPMEGTFNFCKAFAENKILVSENRGRRKALPTGGWDKEATHFLHLPIYIQGDKHPIAIISAALNPYRQFDELYQQFTQLIADQISTEINNVLALEKERKRAEALAEIDKAKTAFFTNISHEFRTPLTLILGSVEQLLHKSSEAIGVEQKETIETTHRNAVRLLRLVNNLLDFSRIEAGKTRAQYRLIDIARYTNDLGSNFRSAIEAAGLSFHIEADTIIQPVYVDKEMWEKIVLNLLSNAFKYTLKGSITLSLTTENDRVVLKVKDTGVGIPENELPKMFQRFHRVQNAVGRTYEGTGIGLSLVSELVGLHGGEISVQSKEGIGTLFTVSIPQGKAHLPAEQLKEEKSEITPALADAFIEEAASLIKQPSLNTSTGELKLNDDTPAVLVVDDNADMREYMKNLLQKQYNVITANNGLEALHQIKKHSPELIVSDVMMPVMDGIQLLKELKKDPQTQNIPLILLSARAGEESRLEGYETGADDYLVKPFSAKELLARVASQISIAKRRNDLLQNVYNVFDEVPFAVAVLKGDALIIEFINQYNLNVWQRNKDEVLGKPLFEVRPEIRAGAEAIHAEVYRTGKRFSANEIALEINTNGKTETRYFNAIIDPMFNEQSEIIGQLATSIEITEQVLARKKVEESENALREMANAMPQLVWVANPNGNVIYYNNRVEEFSGAKKSADGTWIWEGMVHEDDIKKTNEAWNNAVQTGKRYEAEHRIKMKDGTYRWFLSRGLPQQADDGKIVKWFGTATDVHDQKMAEEEVRRFKYMADHASDPFILMRQDGTFAYLNKLALERWGYTEEEAKHIRVPDVDPIYNDEVFTAAFARAQKEPLPPFETLHKKKNGITYPVEVNMGGLTLGGKPHLFAVARDITERKKSEEVLNYRKALLEAQNEAIPDAILIVDTKGKIISYNKHFAALWHIPQEIIDRKDDTAALAFAMTQVTDPQAFIDRVNYCYSHPDETAHEEVLFKDGRIIERYGNAVNNEEGISYGWIWYFRDVTERKRAEEALRSSEDRYQNFIRQSTEGIWRFELEIPLPVHLPVHEQIDLFFRDAYLAECNDAMAKMYGYERATELTGMRLSGFFPRNSDTEAYFTHFITSGYRVQAAESEEYTKGGGNRYFMNNLLGIIENGFIQRAWGTQRDITAQKEAEVKLKEGEARFRTTFENAAVGIAHVGLDGTWLFINNRISEILGYTKEELQNLTFQQVTHPDDLDADLTYVEQLLEGNISTYAMEKRYIRKDGSVVWVNLTVSLMHKDDGAPKHFVSVIQDITERKKAQDAVQESETRFRTLAETLPQLVWITNERGEQEYASSRWKEYTGIEPTGTETWQQMVHPDDMPVIVKAWMESITSGGIYKSEARLKNKNGEYRWHFVQGEPIRNEEGKIIKWIGAFTDVHDQKTIAEKLENLVAERTKQLERSNEDLQQFAHVASHDLKEPVRKVRTFGSRLNHEFGEVLPEKARMYIEKMEAAATRMYGMIDGVLLYSSLSAVEQTAEPVDLNEVVRNIESDLELIITQKKAVIQYHDLPVLEGSTILLYQLFYNLINNSLKFSRIEIPPFIQIISESIEAGQVKSDIERSNEKYVRLIVEDNGIGFGQNDAEKIFKTFSRLNSKDKYEGTGLGLALCKKIVDRHGGSISAKGAQNEGASFEIILPLKQKE